MAFSDDDDEEMVLPESVNNYHFEDERGEPICFSVLPFQWEEGQDPDISEKPVFLHGIGDDGLQKIYKQVTSWKLDLEGIHPDVHVLSKDKKWIKLLKPRKSFEEVIRKILITIQCLHYLKRNPESSYKSLWDHVRKTFSHYELRASQFDLFDHIPFFREMVKRDNALQKSELLPKLLEDACERTNAGREDLMNGKISDFIIDDDEVDEESEIDIRDDSDDGKDCFDSVCAICDNGGELLCCEGPCMRSFHGIKEVDHESKCRTLGYTRAEVQAIQNFECLNCLFKKHQCFACGRLGSSDKSSGAEVFRCASGTCAHFYHPLCVAKLLNPENEMEASEQEKRILAGEIFVCPAHNCVVCKGMEQKDDVDLQFAMCRRCPRSYHRKCLPRKIYFEDDIREDDEPARAWDDLLPNRILIYCRRHKIVRDLGTPIRNHLKFPEDPNSRKLQIPAKRRHEALNREKAAASAEKTSPMVSSVERRSKNDQASSGPYKRSKTSETPKKANVPPKADKISVREMAKTLPKKELDPLKSSRKDIPLPTSKADRVLSPTSTLKKMGSSVPVVDSETEKRVVALVKRSASSVPTLENFVKKKNMSSTHTYSARQVDKSITMGKLERSLEALQTALQKVDEDNGSTNNAKYVCEPEILNQIMKWRQKLGIYLGPFLHGLLYTSFGRHFTKVDKLKEIVDRLHWYVQSGDMIVDFCCGANDFSILMKEKLEATGKKCSYRNYDIIPPKNDFNFIKKDWMKVRPKELPTGSQLIMGLNPPFGVKASLANKFIDKALEFKPKLLILIVPKETERLDEKKGAAYDLIWEDDEKLAGRAFYLPGTVDVNDKQLDQWNVQPPPLYLWSRADWTTKHKDVAMKHGHTYRMGGNEVHVVDAGREEYVSDHHTEENHIAASKTVKTVAEASPRENEVGVPKLISQSDGYRPRGLDPENASYSDKKWSEENPKTALKKSNGRDELLKDRDVDELSDMSISPSRQADQLNHCSPEALETPSAPSDGATCLAASPRSSDLGITYRRDQIAGYPSERLESLENLYPDSRREVSLASGSQTRAAYGGDSGNGNGGRDNGFDGYSQRPYGVEERSTGCDPCSLVRLRGQQDIPDLRTSRYTFESMNFRLGQVSSLASSSYGISGPTIGSSAMDKYAPWLDETNRGFSAGTPGSLVIERYATRADAMSHGFSSVGIVPSTMERYAPRLDEMNHVKRPTLTPEIPLPGGERRVYNTHGPWGGLTSDSIGFAAGPQQPFQYPGTSGWLDD